MDLCRAEEECLKAREIIQPRATTGTGLHMSNALQAASWKGNRDVVKLLLENGAEVNAQGGEYGSALQAASVKGNEDIVRLLLERGRKSRSWAANIVTR